MNDAVAHGFSTCEHHVDLFRVRQLVIDVVPIQLALKFLLINELLSLRLHLADVVQQFLVLFLRLLEGLLISMEIFGVQRIQDFHLEGSQGFTPCSKVCLDLLLEVFLFCPERV
jgi:hypothetical protein